jgi:F0F1-type ATP synthase assembly protein I
MSDQDAPKPSPWRFASVGFELAGAVAGLSLIGYWVDTKFNSSPWGILTGAALGIVGGLYNVVRISLLDAIGATRKRGPRSDKDAGGRDDDRD